MASAPTLATSSKETTNYARLCRLLVDGGTKALRYTFDKYHPPANLFNVLKAGSAEHSTVQSLKKKKIINATQWGKLYPSPPSSVTSKDFDITLLMVLLRNICGLTAPATTAAATTTPASTHSWDRLPPASDTTVEANIVRVKYYRNSVYGHAKQASVDDSTFNSLWMDIKAALVALGVDAAAITKLKTETMDPEMEKHYRELVKEWKKDEDNIKDQLDRMEGIFYQCFVVFCVVLNKFRLSKPKRKSLFRAVRFANCGFFCCVNHLGGPLRKQMFACASLKGHVCDL